MNKKKKAILIVLLVVIVISTVALVKYYDVAFRQEVEITYPDGCKETYIRGELITPPCVLRYADNFVDVDYIGVK